MLNVKLKLAVILVISLFAFTAKSQGTADSIQIKLEQYKKLYESGAIDEEEYNKMKLQLQPAPKTNPVVISNQPKAVDSTQIKLDQYKKLLDTGAIGEDEYNRLKAQLLGTPMPEAKPEPKSEVFLSKVDTMSMQALKERYKAKIIAGSAILSVGGAFLVGDILMATLSHKLNPADSLYSLKVSTRRGSEIALGVLGGLATIGGSVFLALGIKDRAVYRRRGKELTMDFNGREFQIAFNF